MLFKFIYFFQIIGIFHFILIYFLVSTFSGTHMRVLCVLVATPQNLHLKILGIKTLVSCNIILGEMTLVRLDCEPAVQHV